MVVIVHTGFLSKMLGKKDFVYYMVSSSIIALIAQLAGASLTVTLFSSLLIPPVLLLIFRIIS